MLALSLQAIRLGKRSCCYLCHANADVYPVLCHVHLHVVSVSSLPVSGHGQVMCKVAFAIVK